jgi:hypothetical protein
MPGDSLGVVASAHGDHAAGSLIAVHREQEVERPAFLERRGELQVLELQEQAAAKHLRERLRLEARRKRNVRRDCRMRIANRLRVDGARRRRARRCRHGAGVRSLIVHHASSWRTPAGARRS